MKKLLAAIAFFSLFCIPAFAQDTPVAEVYGGYQLFHHPGGVDFDSINYHGFLASVEGNVTPYLGAVGEIGFSQRSLDIDSTEATERYVSFLFGPRASYRMENIRLFGHFLLGGIRYSLSDGLNYNDSNFGFVLGGGVDISINDFLSVRPAQLDLLTIKWADETTDEWFNHLRYSGGIVLKFGSK